MSNVNVLLVSDLSKLAKTPAYDGMALTFTSDKVKGDGQLKVNAGVHTFATSLRDFIGTISIQGTLKINPTEDDWFNVWLDNPNPTNLTSVSSIICAEKTTNNDIYIAKGNFYWLRCVVDPYTAGSINFIRLLF
jgi:hypothetical protein